MHFIAKLQEITEEEMIPHSITNMSHRGVPYQLQAIKNSYRMYSLSALKSAGGSDSYQTISNSSISKSRTSKFGTR